MPLAVTVRSAHQVKLVGGIRSRDNRAKGRSCQLGQANCVGKPRDACLSVLLWLAIMAIGFAVIAAVNAGWTQGSRCTVTEEGEKLAAAKP